LGSILARLEGDGSFEVLRLNFQGYLTEGTISNFFLVKDGILYTPPAWIGVLQGISRARVLRAARRWRMEVREIPVTRHELFNADEAFLTNVLMGVLPIRRVDGRAIGSNVPGPWTLRFMRLTGKRIAR